jgi:uncharacterized cupin superfamily protein
VNCCDRLEEVAMPQIEESAWGSDDETPGQVAMLVQSEEVLAGLWRSGGVRWDPFEVKLEFNETIYVLAGSGELQVNEEPPLHLSTGDTLTIPKGSLTRWSVGADFVELWIYH